MMFAIHLLHKCLMRVDNRVITDTANMIRDLTSRGKIKPISARYTSHLGHLLLAFDGACNGSFVANEIIINALH